MSSSNCCFLACIQISHEAGQVVWYSHLFQNFPQFIVIQTVKGFGIVNKSETFFWNSLAFLMIQWMLATWSLVPLPFLKPAWTSRSSWFMYCWSLTWRILSITLLACEMSATVNQGCQEKYQQPQICRWYHYNGRKWRGTKEPLDEGEGAEWKSQLKTLY